MILSLLASLVGVFLISGQILLLFFQGRGLCISEGCTIIEKLTLIPPLYFNAVGVLFFLIVCFALLQARKNSASWKRVSSFLLLTALAVEGVLFSFQVYISQSFCSYCLIVFGLIIVANIGLGIKQIFQGGIIFFSVMAAFAVLDFRTAAAPYISLDQGVMAQRIITGDHRQVSLFFSKTCPHCEKILKQLQEEPACSINFNPIEPIKSFDFPQTRLMKSYQPDVNVRFLTSLGITEVPVILSESKGTTTIITGEQAISRFLHENCRLPEKPVNQNFDSSQSSIVPLPLPGITTNPPDGCSISEDCSEQKSQPKSQ